MNKPYNYYEHIKLNNIKELIELNYLKNKNKIAFKYIDNEKTYADFYDDVLCLSNYIKKKYHGSNIAIIGENSYNYLVIFFSIILSGNVAVLIDKDLNNEEIDTLLKKSDSKIFFYSKSYCDIQNLINKYKTEIIENIGYYIKPNTKIKLDNYKPQKFATIFFTSGTTGSSKAVCLSEKNILSDIYSSCSLFKPEGLAFSCLPFHHAFGLITSILMPFYYNVPIWINSSLKNVLKEINIAKPNTMFVVPAYIETFYKQIWKTARKKKKDALLKASLKISNKLVKVGVDFRNNMFKSIKNNFGGNLEYIICGGASLEKKYVKWFRSIGINILNGYGITECSPVVAVNRNHHFKDGSVGLLGKDIQAKIVENEVYIKGDIVMVGYYKDKSETNKVIKNKYFTTGDYGYIDKDGFLYITGRKKNLIILSNGENISPESIEKQFAKNKGVAEVVLYELNNKLIVEIYPTDDYLGNKTYFKGLLYKYNFMVPKNHQVSDIVLRNKEFPKNNNKKILRNKVLEEAYERKSN